MPRLPETHSTSVKAPKHESKESKQKKNMQAYERQHKRALPTNSTPWMELRKKVLRNEPLCRTCKQQGRLTIATEVDHMDGNASSMESNRLDNLMPLCKPHHSAKTNRKY
jgi:5-methylcytosine-specific restriction enzyme A